MEYPEDIPTNMAPVMPFCQAMAEPMKDQDAGEVRMYTSKSTKSPLSRRLNNVDSALNGLESLYKPANQISSVIPRIGHDENKIESCSMSVAVSGQKLTEKLLNAVRIGYLLHSESDLIGVSIENRPGSPDLSLHDALERATGMVEYLEAMGVDFQCKNPKGSTMVDGHIGIDFDFDLWTATMNYKTVITEYLRKEESTAMTDGEVHGDTAIICCMIDRFLRDKTGKARSLKMTPFTWILSAILSFQMALILWVIVNVACPGRQARMF